MRCQNRIYGAEFSEKDIKKTAESGRLLSMEVEFNRDCNFNCLYCYVQSESSDRKELTREESKDVLMQARDLGVKKIIILGGEPMLYPHIFEMLEFIRENGMEMELFTNGSNITLSAARKLIDLGVVVVLKMNTKNEKLQDILSGRKGAYKQIHEAFFNLKEVGYTQSVPMGISSIICNQNIDELTSMWEWMRDQNVDPYFEMITPQGNARENGMLDIGSSRARELFERIAEIDLKKYGYYWKPQPPLVGGQCLRHQFSCVVNIFGDVLPCVGVTLPVGNIRDSSLASIIKDSEIIEDLRDYRNSIKGPCGKCDSQDVCYGCRGAAYQLTGDYLASDPSCWKNAEKQDQIFSLPINIEKLVPHEKPMLVVDVLLEVEERKSLSEFTVTEDSIFVTEEGRLNEVAYPEIFSQAIAAQHGFKNMGKGNSNAAGFLLGVKKLEILDSAYVGDKLHVSVYKSAKFDGFGIIDGKVFKGDRIIARGEIKVWHNDNSNGSAAENTGRQSAGHNILIDV